jgi:hypothetical protein
MTITGHARFLKVAVAVAIATRDVDSDGSPEELYQRVRATASDLNVSEDEVNMVLEHLAGQGRDRGDGGARLGDRGVQQLLAAARAGGEPCLTT